MLQQPSVQQMQQLSHQQQHPHLSPIPHHHHPTHPFSHSQHLYQPAQHQPFLESLSVFLPLIDSHNLVSGNNDGSLPPTRNTDQ
jgi:hypothetical protein